MARENPDYYQTLGVERGAPLDKIRKSFKKLARETHPDHHPGDPSAEERFKLVNEAWQVLSDDKKRALYDRYGIEGLREGFDPEMYEQAKRWGAGGGAGFGGGGAGFGGFGGAGFGGFEGMDFESIFGGRQPRRAPQERVLRVTLSFDEALKGAEKSFSYPRERACAACKGTGLVASTTCGVCKGGGRIREEASADVRIPKGAASGDRLRLRGRGDVNGRGQAGDVLLELVVASAPRFRREELNIIGHVEVTPLDLILGKVVEVEGPWGPLKMRLNPGADPSRPLRAGGRGVERGKQKGDFLVELRVVPIALSDEQRERLSALRDELSSG